MTFFCNRRGNCIQFRKFHFYFIPYFKLSSIPCNMYFFGHFQTSDIPIASIISMLHYHKTDSTIWNTRFPNSISPFYNNSFHAI